VAQLPHLWRIFIASILGVLVMVNDLVAAGLTHTNAVWMHKRFCHSRRTLRCKRAKSHCRGRRLGGAELSGRTRCRNVGSLLACAAPAKESAASAVAISTICAHCLPFSGDGRARGALRQFASSGIPECNSRKRNVCRRASNHGCHAKRRRSRRRCAC
jgi:hypothetical protein